MACFLLNRSTDTLIFNLTSRSFLQVPSLQYISMSNEKVIYSKIQSYVYRHWCGFVFFELYLHAVDRTTDKYHLSSSTPYEGLYSLLEQIII